MFPPLVQFWTTDDVYEFMVACGLEVDTAAQWRADGVDGPRLPMLLARVTLEAAATARAMLQCSYFLVPNHVAPTDNKCQHPW